MLTAFVFIVAWLASGYAASRIVAAIAATEDGRAAGIPAPDRGQTACYMIFGLLIFVPLVIATARDVWEGRR